MRDDLEVLFYILLIVGIVSWEFIHILHSYICFNKVKEKDTSNVLHTYLTDGPVQKSGGITGFKIKIKGLPWRSSGLDSSLSMQGISSIPGQGTEIPHAARPKKKKKRRIKIKINRTTLEVGVWGNSFNLCVLRGTVVSGQANSQTWCQGRMRNEHKATL